MPSHWISGAIGKKGQLHRDLGIKQGQPIPMSKLESAITHGGKVGKRAQLAKTLRSFKH